MQCLRKKLLGGLLRDAARLAIVMRFQKDKTLLETRLGIQPPLHPRRTLDQHSYWMSRNTRPQDKS